MSQFGAESNHATAKKGGGDEAPQRSVWENAQVVKLALSEFSGNECRRESAAVLGLKLKYQLWTEAAFDMNACGDLVRW